MTHSSTTRHRIAAAAGALAAALALTGCGAGGTLRTHPSAPQPSGTGHHTEVSGVPAKPTAQQYGGLIAALRRVDPKIDEDEYTLIGKAKDQCLAIDKGAPDAARQAQKRFSTPDHTVSPDDARRIDAVLRRMYC